MRVIVVGAGIMGLSCAWALARGGHEVVVVDRAGVPNPLGSSVDQHRLIRHPYGAMEGYGALIDEAYAAWDQLWADLGERLYVETGTLCLGGPDQPWLQASAAALERRGIAVVWQDAAELARRFPLIQPLPHEIGFHLPSGGALLAGRIVERLAHHLAARGVTVMARQQAVSVDPERAGIRLADGRALAADRLIVAAGPWVGRLLPAMAGRVTPSRQLYLYLAPSAERQRDWARMPMVLDIEPGHGFYLVPPVAGTPMKVGDHTFSLTGDPDRDREATEEEAMRMFETWRARLNDTVTVAAARTCFYTVEPEERFIVEPVGARGWVVSACSGHGFKFGPLLGLRLAEAVAGRLDPQQLTGWAAGAAP